MSDIGNTGRSGSTFSTGITGDIIINTTNFSITNEGRIASNLGTASFSGSEGISGDIIINTANLSITNGGRIDSSTFGDSDGGDIKITASESVSIDGENTTTTLSTSIRSQALFSAKGNAGQIEINTPNFSLTNGGQVLANTGVSGNAGNISINTTELINITGEGSGIFATTSPDSTGKGGNITIGIFDSEGNLDSTQFTGEITLSNQGNIAADSEGTGSGGAITIRAEDLNLDEGEISATTNFLQTAANPSLSAINFFVEDNLTLRNNSKISAQATNNADGGNVNIDAEFIIAYPPTQFGSDILANATEKGNGGKINITTKALFGIEERPLDPFTNDINASSEFGLQGNISVNTPEFDPTSGLIELPEKLGDATDQISQNICEQGVGSEFIITGKGGLPPNPHETLNSDDEQVGLVEPVPLRQGEEIKLEDNDSHSEKSTAELVPAQGWIFNDKGEVTLTSYKTPNTEIKPSPQQKNLPNCSSGL